MTLDEAVALSLVPFLPRVGLTEHLVAGDLVLLDEAARRRSARVMFAFVRSRQASACCRGTIHGSLPRC